MAASDEVVSPEGDKGEQRQQGRRGAGDGFVGPLALSFNTEVAPNLFERDLDRPAPDEPAQDVQGVGPLIPPDRCTGRPAGHGRRRRRAPAPSAPGRAGRDGPTRRYQSEYPTPADCRHTTD